MLILGLNLQGNTVQFMTIPYMYLEPKWNPLVLNGVWAFWWKA